MLLQLNHGFNIQALEAFVSSKVIDIMLIEAKAEVEADRRGAASKEVVAHRANDEGALEAAEEEVEIMGAALEGLVN